MQLAPKTWTDPWLNGFPYRKPIPIAGSTSTLTQYQVNVTPYIYNETGLVGSWHFSESSGNVTADSSGQGNTGYQYGSNRTENGKFGNAMKFDGTDDYIQVTSPAGFPTGNSARTLEAWVNIAGLPTSSFDNVIFAYGSEVTSQGFILQQQQTSNLLLLQGYGDDLFSNSALSTGKWYHLAVTYDGSTLAIYINGTLDNSAAKSYTTTLNANGFRIGESILPSYSNRYFNGTIDEVRIYNRTLSATEVQQLYNATKARLDYADVRFTDSDGATLLPFWMESDGKFWVKVPSIPTTGTTIYAYYGNPAATDAQNGTGTFIGFGGLSSFTEGDPASQIRVDSDSMVSVLGGVAGNNAYLFKDIPDTGDFTFEFESRIDSHAACGNFPFAVGLSDSGTQYARTGSGFGIYAILICTTYWRVLQNNGGSTTEGATDVVGSYGQVLYFRLVRTGTTITLYGYSNADRTALVGSRTITGLATNVNKIQAITSAYAIDSATATGFVQSPRVRKYSAPEPSATQGTEESLTTMSGGAQNWTWNVPSPAQYVRSGGAQDWNWKPYQQYLGRYRKPMTIAGSTSALTDHQVNVTPYIYNETGLVGSWHFSESSGNATADSSGQGNTGYQYGTNRTTDGKVGNAMKFDGVDDYVDTGLATNKISNVVTMMAWVNLAAGESYGSAVSSVNFATDTGFGMGIKDGKVAGLFSHGVSSKDSFSGTTRVINGSWQHIAFTYDGTTAKLYVNGSQEYSGTPAQIWTTNSNSFRIGRSVAYNDFDEMSYELNATIDEVRIYNRTLSASEIAAHYNATKARLDYADVRFTDSDGATLLPFWMESDGKFWVKVPSIPTTGTTIYAYYGNPQANDAQNGTGTFVVWDDFASDNGQWTKVDPGSNFAITNGRLEFTNIDQSSAQHSYVYKTIPAIGDFAIDYKWVISSWTTDARAGVGLANSTGSMAQVTGGIYAGTGEDTGAWIIYTTTAHGATDTTPTASEIDSGSSNYVTFTRAGSTAKFNIFSNPTRTTHKTGSPLAWAGAPTASYTVAYAYSDWAGSGVGTSATGYIDDVRVRKYSAPEPSATHGTEEDSLIPQNITVPVGNAMNWTWYPAS